MRLQLLYLTCWLITIPCVAQDPAISWQNTIGGDNWDNLWALIQTQDGGYLAGGWSASDASGDKTGDSNGAIDYWIVRLTADGQIVWEHSIGGSGDDYLYALYETEEGDFILGGKSNSGISGDKTEASRGNFDYWVVKVDGDGEVLWDRTLGGPEHDHLWDVRPVAGNGYLMGGYSRSGIGGEKAEPSNGGFDYWIIAMDAEGQVTWQNTIGGQLFDQLKVMVPTQDGGYLLGGDSESPISGDKAEASRGQRDYWIVKVDASGEILWQRTLGGTQQDHLESVIPTGDGGFLIGGYSSSEASGEKTEGSRGADDYWLVRLSSSGTILWDRTFGGNDIDKLYSLARTESGTYLLGGYATSGISGDKTEASNGGPDYWLLEIDQQGNLLKQNAIGGSMADILTDVRITTDGGAIAGGYSFSDISGDKDEDSNGFWDFWIVKLSDILGSTDIDAKSTIALYPVPAQDRLFISSAQKAIERIALYDSLGRLLGLYADQSGDGIGQLDVSGLPSGMYFLEMDEGNLTVTRGFIKR